MDLHCSIEIKKEYARIGDGSKTMVMLPGLSLKSTLPMAELIARKFSKYTDYTIYLFDDRDIQKGYTLKQRADDVAEIMNRLHLKDAYVFGASMGGMVAQILAAHHPELVRCAVLAATWSKPNAASVTVFQRWMDLARTGKTRELAEQLIRDVYSPSLVSRCVNILADSVGEVSARELEVFLLLCGAVLAFDSTRELKRIKCPVFAVGSEGDKVLGVESTRFIQNALDCSAYYYGEEFGHAFYDETADFKDRMLRFFEHLS